MSVQLMTPVLPQTPGFPLMRRKKRVVVAHNRRSLTPFRFPLRVYDLATLLACFALPDLALSWSSNSS